MQILKLVKLLKILITKNPVLKNKQKIGLSFDPSQPIFLSDSLINIMPHKHIK